MSDTYPPIVLTPALEAELKALRAYTSRFKTAEDLAREQGIQPITDFNALRGVWPEEEREDGFEEAVLRWRREGMVGGE